TDNGVGISEQEMAHANWRLDNPPVVDVAVSRRMGLFVVGRLAARHGVRVRLRHAQSGGLTALIWLPESVAAPEGGQPLGRLRKFETDDYGPAPSLSAPTSGGTVGAVGGFGGGTATMQSGPAAGVQSTSGQVAGGNGGLSGAAATAARIPRLGGGPAGSGNGTGNGAFSAFGNGAARSTSAAPPAQNGGGGNGAGSGTLDAPGGPLPVRTPGNHPLGPGTPANGGDTAFGGDNFGDGDFATTQMPALGGDGGSAGAGGPVPSTSPASNGIGGSDGSQVTIPPTVGGAADHRLPIFDSLESDWFRRSGKPLGSEVVTAGAAGHTWNSPADEGWRAARIVASPEAGETTTAGLPKRVPRANLVPGSVGGGGTEETEGAPPVRSADTIRSRMSSFQRGVREARAAAPQNEEP
ncbi:MAG: ATP-binding protein, partial [Trebonia sp.]